MSSRWYAQVSAHILLCTVICEKIYTFKHFKPTCLNLCCFSASASWGAGGQWRRRSRWSVWVHHNAEPNRKKGDGCSVSDLIVFMHFFVYMLSIIISCCRQDVQCVEEVKELILDQCGKNSNHSTTELLEKVLNDTSKPVGLLLSERFINVPPQIALPLHKQLQWVQCYCALVVP